MRRALLLLALLLAGPALSQPVTPRPCRMDGADCFALAYSNLTGIAASKLLGRGSAGGTGAAQEITLGTGLSMSGTTLSASGGGPLTLTVYTSDHTLAVGQTGQAVSNAGASGTVILTLPATSVTGVMYTVLVEAGYLVYVCGNTGVTVRRQTNNNQCLSASTVGTNLVVMATSDTTWVQIGGLGSWTSAAHP